MTKIKIIYLKLLSLKTDLNQSRGKEHDFKVLSLKASGTQGNEHFPTLDLDSGFTLLTGSS